jgi:monovalent cation:H+ antiporter-2, CPA2 family
VVTLVLLVGIPVLAVTQPFVSARYGVPFLAAVLVVLGVALWRGATNLQEHVQAGAQVIVEALGNQSGTAREPTLDEVQALLPGFGPLTPVRLGADSLAVGKTLAQINLRAVSGASVVTILRGTEGLKPTGREELHEGDVLALAGTHDAIAAAKAILRERGTPQQA